eukprot:142808-Pleurochrysis_carterae.AAC.3
MKRSRAVFDRLGQILKSCTIPVRRTVKANTLINTCVTHQVRPLQAGPRTPLANIGRQIRALTAAAGA